MAACPRDRQDLLLLARRCRRSPPLRGGRMTARPLAIVGSGLVSGVGLSAPASCAAIRCGMANFQETRFVDAAGEWIIGSPVALDPPCWGQERLLEMLARAVRECMGGLGAAPGTLPLLLCVA